MSYDPLIITPFVLTLGGGISASITALNAATVTGWSAATGLPFFLLALVYGLGTFFLTLLTMLAIFAVVMYTASNIGILWAPKVDLYDILQPGEWVDAHRHTRMSFEAFVEAFIHGKCDFKANLDPLEVLEFQRNEYFWHGITLRMVGNFCTSVVPQLFTHTKIKDINEIQETYDRGDQHNFYSRFLGPSMIYTSGVWRTGKETLEEAQENKMDLISKKLQLKKGDRHLDLGCGWGTLSAHSAKNYGTKVTGVTLSKDGKEHAESLFAREGLKGEKCPKIELCDYRDTPGSPGTSGYGSVKYDKISNVEMSEHVGVLNYSTYMKQIYEILEDDGIYFLQFAGLRRRWEFEDLTWALFMNRYIFPGADASCPLAWFIDQMESSGFEVRTVENIGIHYSRTIRQWYHNWMSHTEDIKKEHGDYWYRLWIIFLAWATIVAKEGRAAAYQIVAHKNNNSYNRDAFIESEWNSYNLNKNE